MTDNLALWHQVEKTDPAHVKAITGKSYKGTSPKPHWIVMKATETFGPIGIGWGFTVDERIERGALISDGFYEQMHIAKVKVWYKWNGERGEVEHIGGTTFSGKYASGKTFTDEDAPKKSVTDALIKALSMIGFAGDIFMGRFDDSKYVQEVGREFEEEKRQAEPSTKDARPIFTSLVDDMRRNQSRSDLRRWFVDADVKSLRKQIPADWDENLKKEMAEYAETLPADQKEAA